MPRGIYDRKKTKRGRRPTDWKLKYLEAEQALEIKHRVIEQLDKNLTEAFKVRDEKMKLLDFANREINFLRSELSEKLFRIRNLHLVIENIGQLFNNSGKQSTDLNAKRAEDHANS